MQLRYAYDNFEDGKVDEVKKILDDAGWKYTNGDGIRDTSRIGCSSYRQRNRMFK